MNTDSNQMFITPGIRTLQGVGFEKPEDDYLFSAKLSEAVIDQYNKEPDQCLDGGNDKEFFSLTFRGQKIFVARNEIGGLTVMLPEEY